MTQRNNHATRHKLCLNNLALERPETPPGRIIAMSLAQDLAQTVSAQPHEREFMIQTAILIGTWLLDEGRPGDWNSINPKAVVNLVPFQDATERSAFLFTFASLVGHAAHGNQIDAVAATTCLEQIAQLADHPAISTFARRCFRPWARA